MITDDMLDDMDEELIVAMALVDELEQALADAQITLTATRYRHAEMRVQATKERHPADEI